MSRMPRTSTHSPDPHPTGPLVAEAICRMSPTDCRRLHATRLGLVGAFVLSLRPPDVGSSLTIVFHPQGASRPLPPIEALVIGAYLDPARATHCGFEVLFPRLDDALLDRLAAVVYSLEQQKLPTDEGRHRRLSERRRHPRISTELRGVLELPEERVPFLLVNMSVGGALLVPERPLPPPTLPLGSWFTITLTAPGVEQPLSLRARVAHHIQQDGRIWFGVEFMELDPDRANRLEELLMDAMHVTRAGHPGTP